MEMCHENPADVLFSRHRREPNSRPAPELAVHPYSAAPEAELRSRATRHDVIRVSLNGDEEGSEDWPPYEGDARTAVGRGE